MEKYEIREVKIPPEQFPVLGLEIPVRELIRWTGKKPGDQISIHEFNHRDIGLTNCPGVMRVKVFAISKGITSALCQECGQRILVDVEELALKPYLEKLHSIS